VLREGTGIENRYSSRPLALGLVGWTSLPSAPEMVSLRGLAVRTICSTGSKRKLAKRKNPWCTLPRKPTASVASRDAQLYLPRGR
jgi:hypothetical protein